MIHIIKARTKPKKIGESKRPHKSDNGTIFWGFTVFLKIILEMKKPGIQKIIKPTINAEYEMPPRKRKIIRCMMMTLSYLVVRIEGMLISRLTV
jgi:hypothetical protein